MALSRCDRTERAGVVDASCRLDTVQPGVVAFRQLTHLLLQGQKFNKQLAVHLESCVALLKSHVSNLSKSCCIDLGLACLVRGLCKSSATVVLEHEGNVLTAGGVEFHELGHGCTCHVAGLFICALRGIDLSGHPAIAFCKLALDLILLQAQLLTYGLSSLNIKSKTAGLLLSHHLRNAHLGLDWICKFDGHENLSIRRMRRLKSSRVTSVSCLQ